jgi:hypothetical protein
MDPLWEVFVKTIAPAYRTTSERDMLREQMESAKIGNERSRLQNLLSQKQLDEWNAGSDSRKMERDRDQFSKANQFVEDNFAPIPGNENRFEVNDQIRKLVPDNRVKAGMNPAHVAGLYLNPGLKQPTGPGNAQEALLSAMNTPAPEPGSYGAMVQGAEPKMDFFDVPQTTAQKLRRNLEMKKAERAATLRGDVEAKIDLGKELMGSEWTTNMNRDLTRSALGIPQERRGGAADVFSQYERWKTGLSEDKRALGDEELFRQFAMDRLGRGDEAIADIDEQRKELRRAKNDAIVKWGTTSSEAEYFQTQISNLDKLRKELSANRGAGRAGKGDDEQKVEPGQQALSSGAFGGDKAQQVAYEQLRQVIGQLPEADRKEVAQAVLEGRILPAVALAAVKSRLSGKSVTERLTKQNPQGKQSGILTQEELAQRMARFKQP